MAEPMADVMRAGRRPRLPALAPTRRARRGAVVAAYGGYAGAVGLLWLGGALGIRPWTGPLALLPAAAMLAGLWALCSAAVGAWRLANDPDARLDERERRVRDRAYRLAYTVVATLLVLGVTWAQVAGDAGWWRPTSTGAMQALVSGSFLLTITLPAAIVAWTEPEPVE